MPVEGLRFVNLEVVEVGTLVVIVGSGDFVGSLLEVLRAESTTGDANRPVPPYLGLCDAITAAYFVRL